MERSNEAVRADSREPGARAWIFQSNPDLYDIDRALEELEEIHWRVPQHTYQVHPGDDVLIWRSGDEAGVIGVGKVLGTPREASPPPDEAALYKDPDHPTATTRVRVRVQEVTPVLKGDLEPEGRLGGHRIITAPMGTVFPLSRQVWDDLVAEFPQFGALTDYPVPSLGDGWPAAFGWSDRLKSVYPLPGGYQGYLDTLDRILAHVDKVRPDRPDLERWLQEELGATSNSARFQLNFLERISLVSAEANRVELSFEGRRWLDAKDPSFLIALVHSRIQLIGELLSFLDQPRTTDELLELANRYYGMGWKSRAQIDRRRGWLESAGMVRTDDSGRLVITSRGDQLLRRLELQPPAEEPAEPVEVEVPAEETTVEGAPPKARSGARVAHAMSLARSLKEAATRSDDPDEFERLTAEGFEFLGFDSSWLGGSGKTDVLLVAELGPQDGYRVIIDCKTTGSGGIPDHQVDWVTLDEHKELHSADYVALVGPEFQGARVRDRAHRHGVSLIDVEELAGLIRQHARIPLGLGSYRHLFDEERSLEGSTAIAELAEESDRRMRLAADILGLLSETQGKEGPLGARDLYWLLQHANEDVGQYEEDEIRAMLSALAAPGIEVLREVGAGYLTLGAKETVAARLTVLARLVLGGVEEG